MTFSDEELLMDLKVLKLKWTLASRTGQFWRREGG